jgi:hypothetical protein
MTLTRTNIGAFPEGGAKIENPKQEAKASSTEGTPQARTERHYLSIARKLKGSL